MGQGGDTAGERVDVNEGVEAGTAPVVVVADGVHRGCPRKVAHQRPSS